MAAHAGFTDMVEWLLDHGCRRERCGRGVRRAARRDHATRYANGERTPRARRRSERAAQDLDADAPIVARLQLRAELVGSTPFWLAARFNEPEVMRLLLKHGANAAFVHQGTITTRNRSSRAPRSPTR
jgi:ankyrin repeat protein